MVETMSISVTKTTHSKLKDVDFNHLPFGKYFTDHMLVAEYANGEWQSVEIKPYQPLALDPALAAIHYGQSIFEGIKAFKNDDGEAVVFRPYENLKRFNTSAERMCMPAVPEEIFIEGMKQLIAVDKDWIPSKPDHSLYIRPFMFATDEVLGVKPSDTYLFIIILSPTGPYYAAPMKICVEEVYTRAAPGGVGFAKNAGNYGGSLIATQIAKKTGYDQILWTDAFEHKWLQEVGTMNVFFIIDGVAITPSLEEGTILAGVTRDSALTVLQEMGYPVEERRISIDELIEAYKAGLVAEVFGTGTAVTISPIQELKYQDTVMKFDVGSMTIAPELKSRLDDIKTGKVPDVHGWMVAVR
ncbi:branched-chain amino acid aminotransferase [Parasediminibacterium sp. JCM 36343]|uniref:branched-chain amino acid aminotransferase n=1 Tax=Parasediminibacterium sp. JCM 36343 TaxID=3374279 RepID=UPI00397A61BF